MWSSWRWSYDPLRGRWWGPYGNWTHVKGWRVGPIIVWRFRLPES